MHLTMTGIWHLAVIPTEAERSEAQRRDLF
jgi:hypothetical protein